MRVRVIGLKKQGIFLNGCSGVICGYDEKYDGVWKVRLDNGTGKAFRPANLERIILNDTEITSDSDQVVSREHPSSRDTHAVWWHTC